MEYIILDGPDQKGPYTVFQIKSMWERGLITANALYWDDQPRSWKPVVKLAEPDETIIRPERDVVIKMHSVPDGAVGGTLPFNVFTFGGRCGRGNFFWLIVFYTAILSAIAFAFSGSGHSDIGTVFINLAFLMWVYLMLCIAVKRMHDIGWPAWGAFFLVAPFTWMFLMVAPGNKGWNDYGSPP